MNWGALFKAVRGAWEAGKRMYLAAAQTPSTASYWGGGNLGDSNSSIRQARPVVSSRVRELVENMPWMGMAISASVAYKVGEGFTFKPAVEDGEGKADTAANALLRDEFLRWCDAAEINGRDTFGDIQQLAVRQLCECGEALLVHRVDRRGNYHLQALEPDVLGSLETADNIDQGVEFDPQTNRFLKFHCRNTYSAPGVADKEYTLDADDVCFLYKCHRPWQRRGISPLASTIIMAADLDQYIGNELSAQQMCARWLAFITDPNEENYIDDGAKRKPRTIEQLQLEFLPPGKSIQFAPGASRPVTGVEAFKTMFLQILAGKLNVPFHLISNNYGGLNYNTLREVRNNLIHTLKPEWAYLVSHLLKPVYSRWMDCAVNRGGLRLKGYGTAAGRAHWQRAWFIPPGIESPDQLRDMKALITGMQAGIKDPQDAIMAMGEDPDDTIAGIAEFKAKLEAAGLIQQLETGADEPDTNIQPEPEESKEE